MRLLFLLPLVGSFRCGARSVVDTPGRDVVFRRQVVPLMPSLDTQVGEM
jgi:hypothetical protein